MTAASASLPPCPVAGCENRTQEVGRPCGPCQAAFGDLIKRTPGGRMSKEEQAAYLEEQLQGDARARAILAERRFADEGEEYTKQNQACWLCEQRRTSTRTERGWECADCKEIT